MGKTSIAKELALRLKAVYLRIDTIEQTLLRENALNVGHEGYLVAYALAEDNLALGHVVIADSVNPIPITRETWRQAAEKTGAAIFEVEIICSDQNEHGRRVEERKADIKGHKLPTWDEVRDRDYHPWERKNLLIDTTNKSISHVVEEIRKWLCTEKLHSKECCPRE